MTTLQLPTQNIYYVAKCLTYISVGRRFLSSYSSTRPRKFAVASLEPGRRKGQEA